MIEYTKNRLLVATPGLLDPNFARTVVLMLEHNDEGALGLILNRPGPLPVENPFPEWAELAPPPPAVFFGGPVTAGAALTLARAASADTLPDEWVDLFGGVGVVNMRGDSDETTRLLAAVRVFSGYAGWSAGQLEGEIEAGGWFVVVAEPDDVFTPDPEGLWSAVLKRQPGRLRIFAECPPDPSTN